MTCHHKDLNYLEDAEENEWVVILTSLIRQITALRIHSPSALPSRDGLEGEGSR